jgi:GNAT superfamily N-acetyltransferase
MYPVRAAGYTADFVSFSIPRMSHPVTPLVRATPDDLPLLLELVREFCSVDQHPYDEARLRECLPALLESDRFGLVWKLGEPAVGYAVVTWGYSLESGGAEALIDEIYLRERGRGLGALVLEAIIDDCRSRGFKRMFLETESHNARVRRFYARAGFEEDDSVWMSRYLE